MMLGINCYGGRKTGKLYSVSNAVSGLWEVSVCGSASLKRAVWVLAKGSTGGGGLVGEGQLSRGSAVMATKGQGTGPAISPFAEGRASQLETA